MNTVEQNHVIKELNGVHMRVAGQLSKFANSYSGDIEIHDRPNKKYANASNTLDLMLLQLVFGQTVTINVRGDDALKTIQEVKALL